MSTVGRRARVRVVDKRHAMADENIVLNRYAFADERVARHFASPAHARILLNLDECSDLCFVSNLASIQIDEFRQLDVLAKLDVRRN